MQNDSSSCTRRTADSDALAAASTRDREPGAGLSSERNLQRAPKRAKRARVLSRNRHHCDRGHETSGQPPPAWSSTDECRPPAVLEYYENDTCGEGGVQEMNEDSNEEECSGGEEETAAAANVSIDHCDISDSEDEGDEQELELEFDDTPREGSSSGGHASAKHQDSTRSRKRKRGEEEMCSSRHQNAAAGEDKRMKESKLKHNKNEQLRRRDLKDAVHKLRNQLRRKTKKPTTISVLRAAIHEIDELTGIKEQEDRELDLLRQRELFLKYRLDSLISDRKKLLSSNEVVSPIRGPPSFVQPPRASPSTPTLPQTISRPTFPQFFPVLPTAAVPVPCSDSAASSPGNPGRIRQIENQQPEHVVHPHIITPPRLRPLPTLPLPQPPSLIPFTATTPPNPFPSTPVTTSPLQASNSIPLLSTLTPSPAASSILPGVSPAAIQFRAPWTPSSPSGMHQIFRTFPPSLVVPYPTHLGRLATSASAAMGGVCGSLTGGHPAARLTMTPTFPFSLGYLSPSSVLHQPAAALGAAGAGMVRLASPFGTVSPSQPGSIANVRQMQPSRHSEHTNGHAMRNPSSSERNQQNTPRENRDTRHRSGSKNGIVSAESRNPQIYNSVSTVRDDSAEVVRTTSKQSRHFAREYRDSWPRSSGQIRLDDRYCGRDGNDSFKDNDDNNVILTTKRMRHEHPEFHRHRTQSVPSVIIGSEKASRHVLPPRAPPLLKMIDSDESDSINENSVQDEQDPSEQGERQELLGNLRKAARPRNDVVISTVIKHLQPQRDVIYVDEDRSTGQEDVGYCRNGEQRWRGSNSLSSSDECPDSPQQQRRINGFVGGGWPICYKKTAERDKIDELHSSAQIIIANTRDLPVGVTHRSSKTFRRRKGSLLRHNI